jgi:hypothetical protein
MGAGCSANNYETVCEEDASCKWDSKKHKCTKKGSGTGCSSHTEFYCAPNGCQWDSANASALTRRRASWTQPLYSRHAARLSATAAIIERTKFVKTGAMPFLASATELVRRFLPPGISDQDAMCAAISLMGQCSVFVRSRE